MHKKIQRRNIVNQLVWSSDVHPILRQVLAHRHIGSVDELNCSLNKLYDAQALSGLEQAAELLADAIISNQRILIMGDFDADGATSSALAVRALRAMGAQQVDFLVPNRFEFGYGLTPEIVAIAAQRKPDWLLTVDNGISSHAGVLAANAAGIGVIITDHHLPGAHLPAARVIVNPNLPNDTFPSKNLAGVGVIFYVLSAVRAALRKRAWFNETRIAPNLAQWLDLVALGTVADVVPLDHNNRILVEQGLRRIRAKQCVPGIQALLAVAGRSAQELLASDLGFVVAPRLNAAGRLDDMALGIRCLLTDDANEARQLAERLDAFNKERRVIERDMQTQALDKLSALIKKLAGAKLPAGLALFDSEWHPGVIGILAARIKETFHRPVIAFAPSEQMNFIKGSARSIPGVHIRDCLEWVHAQYPSLIQSFGGHAMAAGLTIAQSALSDFQAAFAQAVEYYAQDVELGEAIIWSDGELDAADLTLETAQVLRDAAPWGQRFAEPIFDGYFEVVERRIVGESHLKLKLNLAGRVFDAIAFNETGESWQNIQRVRASYKLDINFYTDQRKLQLQITHIEAAD
ncbi:MAG: single-stranded-DNA-specific exonuclease RecJ [Gammaproteobacteria bacterium]|nr:single-stranded-DNA-specific exonuclease RecJ [Gammaproteobacteria bacterium]